MMNRTRRILARSAALVAAPVVMLSVGAAGAHADTPDDHWWESSWGDGSVMWNDYDTERPDIDYDNLVVADDGWWDTFVWVQWENGYTGETGTTRDLHHGDTTEVDVGPVPDGEKVHFWMCIGDGDNHQDYCDDWQYFVE